MIRLAWAIEELQEALDMLCEVAPHLAVADVNNVCGAQRRIGHVILELQGEDRENRINYVADKRAKEAEARSVATKIIQGIKHARLTPEERQTEADRDNEALFGTREERGNL